MKRDPRIEIPVIGNGDITTPEEALRAFEDYGVDAVMIGRASIGAPWIFREVRRLLDGEGLPSLTPFEKADVLRQQIKESIERIDEYRGILHVRRHLAATPLFKGLPNFRETRIRMLRADTEKELLDIISEIMAKFFIESNENCD